MNKEFNAHMITVCFLPLRARTKTINGQYRDTTFEGALEKARKCLKGVKVIKWATTREVFFEIMGEENKVYITNYPEFCPTKRRLTEEELLKIKS